MCEAVEPVADSKFTADCVLFVMTGSSAIEGACGKGGDRAGDFEGDGSALLNGGIKSGVVRPALVWSSSFFY